MKQEYATEVWSEEGQWKYSTQAPNSNKDSFRYYRAYSSANGEEFFYGTVLHFENCFGGVGGSEGGVLRGLKEAFPNCEISIIDSSELPKY